MDFSGIYCIENILDNKKYIGQSQTCNRRIQAHKNNLRKNKDTCIYLQNAWNKYGEENFYFYIIEKCSVEKLNDKEIFYIDNLESHISKNGYNISFGGDAPMRNRKHSEKTRAMLSDGRRKKENHPNYGKPMSNEQKKKLSEDRIGEKHWSFGKKHSPETIQKMKENNKRTALGKKMSNEQKNKRSRDTLGKIKSRKISTQYKGVTFHKASNKWRARISERGQDFYIGLFLTDIDAAKAYDKYVWEKYKDKNMLNFPEDF